MDAKTTTGYTGFEVHIQDEAKKDDVIQFISWNNPYLGKALFDAAWLKKGEKIEALFIAGDGISVKIGKEAGNV